MNHRTAGVIIAIAGLIALALNTPGGTFALIGGVLIAL